jgi:hypothetical protein
MTFYIFGGLFVLFLLYSYIHERMVIGRYVTTLIFVLSVALFLELSWKFAILVILSSLLLAVSFYLPAFYFFISSGIFLVFSLLLMLLDKGSLSEKAGIISGMGLMLGLLKTLYEERV